MHAALDSIERRFASLDERQEDLRCYFSAEAPPARGRGCTTLGTATKGKHRFAKSATSGSSARRRLPDESATTVVPLTPGTEPAGLQWPWPGRPVPSLVTEGDRVRRIVADGVSRRGAALRRRFNRADAMVGPPNADSDSDDGTSDWEQYRPQVAPPEELLQVAERGELFRPPSRASTHTTQVRRMRAPNRDPTGSAQGRSGTTQHPVHGRGSGSTAGPGAMSQLSSVLSPTVTAPTITASSVKGGARDGPHSPDKRHGTDGALAGWEEAREKYARAGKRDARASLLRRAKCRVGLPPRPASAAAAAPPPDRPQLIPRPGSAAAGRIPGLHAPAPPTAVPPVMPGGRRPPRRVTRPRGPDPRTIPMPPKRRDVELADAINRKEYYYLHVRIMHSNESLMSWRFDVKVTDVTFPECPLTETFPNLRVNPTMHIVFREPNDCILSPVDDLPWVQSPADLYRHSLRVEVTGVAPHQTKVVDTLVYYGDDLPIPAVSVAAADCAGVADGSSTGDPAVAANDADAVDSEDGSTYTAPCLWESAGQLRSGTGQLRGRASPAPYY